MFRDFSPVVVILSHNSVIFKPFFTVIWDFMVFCENKTKSQRCFYAIFITI